MATFHDLAELADKLAETSSRLKKRAAIADALLAIHTQDKSLDGSQNAGLFAQFLAGIPFAEADPRKVNAGSAMLSRIVSAISNATDAAMTAAYRRYGDFGASTEELLRDAKHLPAATITLQQVANALGDAAGAKSNAARQATLQALLERSTPLEAKYLIKLLLGDMRIGVKQSLVEEAIAVAAGEAVHDVRHAVMLEADLVRATTMAFHHTLHEAQMRLFHPLGFMLASPVDTPEEAIKRFAAIPEEADVAADVHERNSELPTPAVVAEQEHAIEIQAQIEDKYDGMRVQLHCGDPSQPGRVALYSRNREDVTESYPEIAEAFANVQQPLILDGELLAWDYTQQRALPFAVLSPRIGRKRVGNDVRTGTPVLFMAFDLLYADGALMLDLPLRARRSRLEALSENLIPIAISPLELPSKADTGLFATEGSAGGVPRLHLSPVSLAYTADDLDRAYISARERGNEGVMVKAADSLYQPGRRGLAWVKLKRALDTLDVVITGAEYGHGKRAQMLSDYTFAIRGPQGELLNVGKAYSGVTDAEIGELTAWLKANTLEEHGHFRTVRPARVLEVAFNNVMRSDRHASGFALRFPRIVRIRDDKPVDEIDTLARVEEIYQSQPDRPMK